MVGLSMADVSSEELFDTWQSLLALQAHADDYLAEMRGRFDKATDLVERERLWAAAGGALAELPGAVGVDRPDARRVRVHHRGPRVAVHGDDIGFFTSSG